MASRKVKYDFNPFSIAGVRLRGSKKEKALRDVKDFVLEQVLSKTAKGESSVSGKSSFKSLSPDYSKIKRRAGRGTRPNLEFAGDLTEAIRVKRLSDTSNLRLTVLSGQQGKADGHNNFSGRSELPRRPFVPDKDRGETLKKDIEAGIERIVKRIKNG